MTKVGKSLNSARIFLIRYRRFIQAGMTLCIGIGLSISACVEVYKWEEKVKLADLQDQLEKIATNLQKDFNANLEVIQAVAGLYSNSNQVEEQEFEQFVKVPLYWHTSIDAIAWLPRVANYKEYFSVKYLFPLSKNEQVAGIEFAANSTHRLTLEKAVDRNEIVATASSLLAGQTDNKRRFLVFLPVKRKNTGNIFPVAKPNLPPLQQKNLKGFVLGVFEIDALLKSTLQEVKIDKINFYLEDLTNPEGQRFLAFYQTSTKQVVTVPDSENKFKMGQKAYCPDKSGCTRIVNIQNRRWSIQLLLTPEYKTPEKYWQAWVVLIFGLLLTSIVTLYLHKLLDYTEQIEKIVEERTAQSKKLGEALQKLQQTQVQLVQTEKMSSLGLLVAGIAHEINNPVNFIHGNLQYANQYAGDLLELVDLYQKYYPNPAPEIFKYSESIDFEFLREDMTKLLSSMQLGSERIIEIVRSLRQFSRLDENNVKLANIHEGIDSTLTILQHRLKAKSDRAEIEVIKQYEQLPLVECNPGLINQVFMNIIVNGIDAIESDWERRKSQDKEAKKYQITIRTEYSNTHHITVIIADNASGMTEQVKNK